MHREIHVSPEGSDDHPGTAEQPLRRIQAAAERAQPGDAITVHAGVYRERIDPPRGGTSEDCRITYQAAPGERVLLLGSENVLGWERVQDDVWMVAIPNDLFGDYNPYAETIRGDWFHRVDRDHHTGAVYVDGEALWEAVSLNEVLRRPEEPWDPADFKPTGSWLFNLRSIELGEGYLIGVQQWVDCEGPVMKQTGAGFHELAFIRDGHRVSLPGVDFSAGRAFARVLAATDGPGGGIELRLDHPGGDVLANVSVRRTGDWGAWRAFEAPLPPVTGVHDVFLIFRETPAPPMPLRPPDGARVWFAKVDEQTTTLWAQFGDSDPNRGGVEINVRPTVFYPSRPGMDFLTIRGFDMRYAATNWSPPTAEQVGLIGTHWSRGWIIEDNTISHSACAGVTLGKYGDDYDNATSQPRPGLGAEYADGTWAYNRTVERACDAGLDRVGHHIVRRNTIRHCGQGGIIGSLGCVFSAIMDNHIHHIHCQRLFRGYEQAGIKLHGAVDTVIARNHIHACGIYGIWLDWMAQGSLVVGNLLHDNNDTDILVEVSHGPFLIANNISLSSMFMHIWSSGGAVVHNLAAGSIKRDKDTGRHTPVFRPHSVALEKLHNVPHGDLRYYNNIFLGPVDLEPMDEDGLPNVADGSVHGNPGPRPAFETHALNLDDPPACILREETDGWYLDFRADACWSAETKRSVVTTALLGKTVISDQAFTHPDDAPLVIDTDYPGQPRDPENPFPGPFEVGIETLKSVKVWPLFPEGKQPCGMNFRMASSIGAT